MDSYEILQEDISLICDGDNRTRFEWIKMIANSYEIGDFYFDEEE